MEKRLLGGVALLVAFCSLASAPLSAQLQTGRLLGTVLDEQHAAVPGAMVTVTNLATNISRTVTSDGEGNYVVTQLDLYGAQIRSGSRRALIFVQQSAETVAAFHCHRSRARPVLNRRSAVRRREVQAAVRSIAVVMINEHR